MSMKTIKGIKINSQQKNYVQSLYEFNEKMCSWHLPKNFVLTTGAAIFPDEADSSDVE